MLLTAEGRVPGVILTACCERCTLCPGGLCCPWGPGPEPPLSSSPGREAGGEAPGTLHEGTPVLGPAGHQTTPWTSAR